MNCPRCKAPFPLHEHWCLALAEEGDAPEVNPLAYVVKETCSQCHQATKETVSGICLNCDYVNRVTASKPR